MSKLGRTLALALLIASAALLLTQALPRREAPETYAATGRIAALPEIGMPGGTVAINTADLYELTELPGVGETIGQSIIDERENRGPFYYPEDLLAVRGIGEKTLEGLRDMLDMTTEDD